jgi:hypothetical protein
MIAKILTTPCLEKVTKLSAVISFIMGRCNIKCLTFSLSFYTQKPEQKEAHKMDVAKLHKHPNPITL